MLRVALSLQRRIFALLFLGGLEEDSFESAARGKKRLKRSRLGGGAASVQLQKELRAYAYALLRSPSHMPGGSVS